MSAWTEKCYIVLINEIVPRAKKLNIGLRDFLNPAIVSTLIKLEYDGVLTRREVRHLLDERVKYIKENDMKEQHF